MEEENFEHGVPPEDSLGCHSKTTNLYTITVNIEILLTTTILGGNLISVSRKYEQQKGENDVFF